MQTDVLRIESRGAGGSGNGQFLESFEDWTAFTMKTSMVEPAEVSLEMGDDTGWLRLNELLQLGSQFQVFLGSRPCLRGRVEAIDAPSDAAGGTTQRLVVRTRMTDAIYSSAPQGIKLSGVTLKQFILACYSSLGIVEADFDFRADVSRDLITGVSKRGGKPPAALDQLKLEQAKVNPPETIYAAVDRHLRRQGLIHWDGPDGKIIVSAPDDKQDPIYFLQSWRAASLAQTNNIVSVNRAFDVSQSPTVLGMYGKGGNKNFAATKIGAVLFNPELQAAGFHRAVVIVDESLRNLSQAQRRAAHEFATRNRGLEHLTIQVDGLSYRQGSELIPYCPDTVVDVVSDAHGGALGSYYCETVELRRGIADGDTATLQLVRQGVWEL